jgi:hypothetical protein
VGDGPGGRDKMSVLRPGVCHPSAHAIRGARTMRDNPRAAAMPFHLVAVLPLPLPYQTSWVASCHLTTITLKLSHVNYL